MYNSVFKFLFIQSVPAISCLTWGTTEGFNAQLYLHSEETLD